MEITAWPPLSTCPLLLQTSRDQSRSLMLSLKPICLFYCTPHPCVPVLTHVLTDVLHRPHILLCRSWLQHDTTVPLCVSLTKTLLTLAAFFHQHSQSKHDVWCPLSQHDPTLQLVGHLPVTSMCDSIHYLHYSQNHVGVCITERLQWSAHRVQQSTEFSSCVGAWKSRVLTTALYCELLQLLLLTNICTDSTLTQS